MVNKFLKSELIFLLNHSEAKNDKLEKAYNHFVAKLHTFIQVSKDIQTTYFILNHTRIELLSLKAYLQSSEKKTVL